MRGPIGSSILVAMNNYSIFAALIGYLSVGPVPAEPIRPQTIEQACSEVNGRFQDARVRVAWTTLPTVQDDVQVSYCILRGEKDAKLEFERDAEIVYFALATEERHAPRKTYMFTIKTSEGRTIQQGPALLQPLAKQPHSCRVEFCQFFTEPGERVVEVSVVTSPGPRKRN
ncbi:MAG TPA: hypothetical protein VGD27_05305 [Longimicrobiales bacterium]